MNKTFVFTIVSLFLGFSFIAYNEAQRTLFYLEGTITKVGYCYTKENGLTMCTVEGQLDGEERTKRHNIEEMVMVGDRYRQVCSRKKTTGEEMCYNLISYIMFEEE